MYKRTYLIGNAHLDPVWQWRIPEGLALVKSTFNAALERMDEYPDYVFTSACAGYYKWIKVSEPELFERIKERVAEGRWHYVGAMWVQPDCNIPSGEAFARQLLYSQKFFVENFGKAVKTGYNVDSFGHDGMLPQLLKKSGIDNYVYMRPNDDNEKPSLPKENLHFWSSPDSSEVLAFRIPDRFCGYGGDISGKRLDYLKTLSPPQMLFFGVGNHGGGPAKRHLDDAESLRKTDDTYVYGGPDDYFEYVRSSGAADCVPHINEDLQHHASGCYSANAKIKSMNRRAEEELIYAEKLAVMSHVLTGSPDCAEGISGAWERVMFNQFHDVLAGCSIESAYTDAYNSYGYASAAALEIGTYAAERISWRINTTRFFDGKTGVMRDRLWLREGEGSPMVVFNPHCFPVKTNVCFGMGWVSGVTDSEDRDVVFQKVRAPYTDGGHYEQCMFEARLPAYGWATYFIFKDEQNYKPAPVENEFTVTGESLENSAVRLVFDSKTGAISSWYDKKQGHEYAAGLIARAVVCDDFANDTWAHNSFDFNRDIGEFSNAKIEPSELGPLRAGVKITSYYGASALTQYVSLERGSSRVSVRAKLSFNESYKLVKLSFPLKVTEPKAVYSMSFGFIEKKADGLEEPSHKWAAVRSGDGKSAALINDCKYSFCLIENDLRFIAARGCAYLDHYGQKSRDNEMAFQDRGEQEFEYALIPFGEDLAPVVREAELLNQPCRLYNETHHKGSLPAVGSGMSVSAGNIIVQAVKPAEYAPGTVIRAFECAGVRTQAQIDFKLLNKSFSSVWQAQEVKTVFFPDGGEPREVMLTEYDEIF